MIFLQASGFDEWRQQARVLLQSGVSPADVEWSEQSSLFGSELPTPARGAPAPRIPPPLLESLGRAACYRGDGKWGVLYRLLWRVQHDGKEILDLASDPDVRELRHMEAEVRRDGHKMKAFVRFRKVGENDYVAWHEPDHLVVERTAPFFARRFATMRWAILTPDRCAYWEPEESELRFGPGLARCHAPSHDEMEELWKTYYANIFNPARVKLAAMRAEMPVKHWKTMPETALIAGLVARAQDRVARMELPGRLEERPDLWAARLVEADAPLEELREAALRCQGCELCRRAKQTVFGQGPRRAPLMLIGEQPGEQEDARGRPFVGPAGQLLRQTLRELGADPREVYLTNVVKHFHWEEGAAGRPLHKRASPAQIETCKPWVEAEIRLVQPRTIVCLGNTPAQALIRRDFRMTRERGRLMPSTLAPGVLATFHPSYLLRHPDEEARGLFREDLQQALALARHANPAIQ